VRICNAVLGSAAASEPVGTRVDGALLELGSSVGLLTTPSSMNVSRSERRLRCVATEDWIALGLVDAATPAVVECLLVWDRLQGHLLGPNRAADGVNTGTSHPALGQRLLQTAPQDAEYAKVLFDVWAECLVGVAKLCVNEYLVFVAESVSVGKLFGERATMSLCPICVQRVRKFSVLPIRNLSKSRELITPVARCIEDSLRRLLDRALRLENFYYSPQWDITQRLQETCFKWDKPHRSMHRPTDLRESSAPGNAFTWNASLLRNLLDDTRVAGITKTQVQALVRPLLFGFVEMIPVRCRKPDGSVHQAQYALISRCSRVRAGVRYFRRGADRDGYVANFVEIESVVCSGDYLTSYVQIRGSIPLPWVQTPNLQYKPRIRVGHDDAATGLAFGRHFERLSARYGEPVVVVDLVNQHGSEHTLQSRYEMEASRFHIPYIAWDFHRECRGMRYERVHELVAQLEGVFALQGVFTADVLRRCIIQRQRGVIRTNCIDCLDRTNVVQSAIAQRMIRDQIRALGFIDLDEGAEFARRFNGLWADHADAMAYYYAGSAALKTDFTRTGRRTMSGVFRDGYSAALRYIINNAYDGLRQDAVDVLLQNFNRSVTALQHRLLEKRSHSWYLLLLWIELASICALIYALLESKRQMTVASLVFLLTAHRLLRRHGSDLVNRPRLCDEEAHLRKGRTRVHS